ncbi:MAG: ComEA family DNA-binding protein [Defluviitaleaceae bacterium]|nr:ComEA family DNA-binding protein [Defluviitaleaceae bacterium]
MGNSIVEFIKKHAFFILGGVCLVAVGVVYMVSRGPGVAVIRGDDRAAADLYEAADVYTPATAEAPEPMPEVASAPEPSYIIVHIAGAVNSPGVVEIRAGARVNDALELAGGANEYADLTRVNLAAPLRDAMQIIVPAAGEEIEEVFVFADDFNIGGADAAQYGLININIASAAELQTLPSIGRVRAQSIIDFRETHGDFTSVDGLINVPGIGSAILAGIRDLVTVG